ncbi:TIGR00375 family protein [Halobacillus fulvus]|nr:TIGR00375 family protein [Halobacillus fulvus]
MSLASYFVDLHIHIGRDWYGNPVKITGSKNLTLTNVVKEASRRKGLDMIGVIDAQSPAVLGELEALIQSGRAVELDGGGIQYEETVLILGSEIEVYDASCQGPIHLLCYFPSIENMKEFGTWLSMKMKNIHLSSQRFYGTARELQQYVQDHGGLFIPAHMFTPFKSLYGKGVHKTLREVLDPDKIDAVELGLSADTSMANQIQELEPYTYLTNSDAHSLGNMAREYQEIILEKRTFVELKKALHQVGDRKILANYGMNPLMGKYHETVCSKCLTKNDPDAARCISCGSNKVVKGVFDRIKELTNGQRQMKERPPYYDQVPLHTIPGLGPKTYEKLIDRFGSEMAIIHRVAEEDLQKALPEKVRAYLLQMRQGKLNIDSGGGGIYGKIRVQE